MLCFNLCGINFTTVLQGVQSVVSTLFHSTLHSLGGMQVRHVYYTCMTEFHHLSMYFSTMQNYFCWYSFHLSISRLCFRWYLSLTYPRQFQLLPLTTTSGLSTFWCEQKIPSWVTYFWVCLPLGVYHHSVKLLSLVFEMARNSTSFMLQLVRMKAMELITYHLEKASIYSPCVNCLSKIGVGRDQCSTKFPDP